MTTFALHFHVRETLPAVHRAARADRDPDTGPIRVADLGSLEWGALVAAGIVNGCGPTSVPDFIPDISPSVRAGGFLHDLRYLAGGSEEDRDGADLHFAAVAPAAYGLAVRAAGKAFFSYREARLSHGELCLIIQAALLVHGYANCQAKAPSVRVMSEIDRLARA